MATNRDVAARAGTSTAVVSYVFNNGPRNVSPATREKVLRAAAELNYQPNALARALSHGRTSSVGLLVPDIANRFFGELARALETAAATRGNLLVVGDAALDSEGERSHIAAFVKRRVDGVVLVSVEDTPDISQLSRVNIPVVALHPVGDPLEMSTISIDYRAAARVTTEHLLGHGYSSVALLNGPGNSAGAIQHRAGFGDAIAGAPSVKAVEFQSQVSREHAAQVALEVLSTPDRPRAVQCATDEQAYGVIFACFRLGLSVPDDVAVAGFDGTEHSRYSLPPLTTVRQPLPDMATRAMDLLLSEPGKPVHDIAIHELIVRESCGSHHADAVS